MVARKSAESGGAFQPFDGQLNYSSENICANVEALSYYGRSFYALSELTLDVAFPIAYVLLFSAIFTALRIHGYLGFRLRLVLPFVAMLAAADLAENVTLATAVIRCPAEIGWVSFAAPIATSVKWFAFFVIGLVLVLTLLFNGNALGILLRYLALLRVPIIMLLGYLTLIRLSYVGSCPIVGGNWFSA